MSLELVLLEKVEADLILKLQSGLFQSFRFSHLQTLFPVLPALSLLSLLDRHIQCVVFQPVCFLFKKSSVLLHLCGRTVLQSSADAFLKPLVRFSEQRIAVFIHCAVVHFLPVRAEPDGFALLPRKKAVADQLFKVDKIRIPREGRNRLIRAVAKSGLAERQHLPHALSGSLEKIDKRISLSVKASDAETGGK